MTISMRSMCVAVGLAASAANADLVVTYTTSHYFVDNLGWDGNTTNPSGFDTLDLSGALNTLTLTAGVPQIGSISDVTFVAGVNSQSGGNYNYVTSQTISLNGSFAQAINQDFHVSIGASDDIHMDNSPLLTFNLGGGNIVTFRALAAHFGPNGGGTWTGDLSGEFTLSVIPLPTGAALGCAGLGLFGAVRRRRVLA